MKKIYVLWASIRPKMVYSTWKEWLTKCKNKENIFLQIAVSDLSQKIEIDSFGFQNCEVFVFDDKPGYNYAITRLTQNLETEDDSILLLLSDDFFPPENLYWDEFLLSKFNDWDGAIFLNDGIQSLVKEGCLCITLACMTFKCLKQLNKIVFHPNYRHFFSDNEAFLNLTELHLLKDDRDIDNVIFEHRHYVKSKRNQDDHDIKNLSYWNEDQLIFDNRVKMNVKERIKI